jgi:hypothetical protein
MMPVKDPGILDLRNGRMPGAFLLLLLTDGFSEVFDVKAAKLGWKNPKGNAVRAGRK